MTAKKRDFSEVLAGRPIVAILRAMEPSFALDIAESVWDRGIGIVEVPVQSAESFDTFRQLIKIAHQRGEEVGAGTVTDPAFVERLSDEGASFTVSPGLDLAVLEASAMRGMPHLPGVGTASEVQQALKWGCSVLKAFPASSLSPSWLREMRGPFPHAQFVATGGITADNAADFIAAGATALGVGSVLQSSSEAARLFDAVEAAVHSRS